MKLKCSEGCVLKTNTPFYYPSEMVGWMLGDERLEPDLGILADVSGNPINMWADGTTNVPDILLDACLGVPETPSCVLCGEQTVWEEIND